ncbi:hypothetical protein GCM10018952_18360 [Streptosporangium vulgare]
MPFIITNSTGMATQTIHAPWVNLVSSTTTSTTPVMTPPKKLMVRERCIWCRTFRSPSVLRCRVQCLTMPIWLSVNDTKTPTM